MSFKRYLFLLLAFFLVFPLNVCADGYEASTEASLEEGCNLKVSIFSDYDLSQGDVFKLAVMDSAENTIILSVDAFEAYYEGKSFLLPEGSYTVNGLVYEGTNSMIMSDIYASDKDFPLNQNEEGVLHIYIGSAQVSYKDQGNLFMSGEKKENSESEEGTTEANLESTTESATEKTELSPVSDNTKKDPDRDKVVEKVKEEQKEDTEDYGFHSSKLISLLFLGCVGAIGIYIWYRKKNN